MCDKQEPIFRRRLDWSPSYQCSNLMCLPVGGSINCDMHAITIVCMSSSSVSHMGEKRNAYRILVVALLERIRYSWEDNIRMDLRGTGWEVVDWINFAFVRDNSVFF